MKQTIKVVSVIAMLILMLLVLAGCFGNNTLVATRENTQGGSTVVETVEMTFRNDRLETTTVTYEFETEEEAEEWYEIATSVFEGMYTVTRSGTTVTMEESGGPTREELIEQLEEEGYTIR